MSPFIDVVIFLLVMLFGMLGLVPLLAGLGEPSDPAETEFVENPKS